MGSLLASNEPGTSNVDSLGDRGLATRMICLVVANVALVASPILATSLSMLGISSIGPFSWASSALYGLAHAPFMLLVVWCGLGTSRPIVRMLGGAAGVLYQATISFVLNWQIVRLIAEGVRQGYLRPEPTPAYFQAFAESLLLIGALSAIWLLPLLVFRSQSATLRLTNGLDDLPASRPQIRLGSLFILTLIVALYLGFGRLAQSHPEQQGFDSRGIAQQGLYLLTFGLIGFWGLRAALDPGKFESRKILLFLCGVLLLGDLYAVCVSWSEFDWSDVGNFLHLMLWTTHTVGLPAVIYLAGLLILRSCGYRLVPHAISRSVGA